MLRKEERMELVEEIREIMSKFEDLWYSDEELIHLRKMLQPSVDCWNDCESEYQHLVDMFGDGVDEYNYDNYIPSKHEKRLVKTINNPKSMGINHHFLPQEVLRDVSQDYLAHKTGKIIEIDFENSVINVYNREDDNK